MTITRTVNGKEIAEDELSSLQATNPTLEAIWKEVVWRIEKAASTFSLSEKPT